MAELHFIWKIISITNYNPTLLVLKAIIKYLLKSVKKKKYIYVQNKPSCWLVYRPQDLEISCFNEKINNVLEILHEKWEERRIYFRWL